MFVWLHPIKTFKYILKENKLQAPKSENTDNNIFRIPWIPIIGLKVRRKLRKTGCQIIFTSAAKLKNILCYNKDKLLPNSYPGVYEWSSDFGRKYIGKANKCALTGKCVHDGKMGSFVYNWTFQRLLWASWSAAPKNACEFTQHTERKLKKIFRSKQFRDESRIQQIHQSIE